MSGLVAKRALTNLRTGHSRIKHNTRWFHNTSSVHKKNKVEIGDLFSDSGEVGELFKDEASLQQPAALSSASAAEARSSPATEPKLTPRKKRLSPEERRTRYGDLLNFVKPRLGRKPELKLPQIRNSAWAHLADLAATKEQLQEIAELFPEWKALGREFDPHFSELFVRRCEQLSCPLLALDVYGNYAKYNLKLTLPGARQLLHSLYAKHPIEKVIAASALYSVHSLVPISRDLVSCSMLVSTCFKHNSKDSLKVARALIPHLQRMIAGTQPTPSKSVEKQPTEKYQTWLQWTLKKVDKALFVQNGSRAEWLRDWRMRSGHFSQPAQF